jgi:hypothetical protein
MSTPEHSLETKLREKVNAGLQKKYCLLRSSKVRQHLGAFGEALLILRYGWRYLRRSE